MMEKIKTSQSLYEKSVELMDAIDINTIQKNKKEGEEEEPAIILISKKGNQVRGIAMGTIEDQVEAISSFLNNCPPELLHCLYPLLSHSLFNKHFSEARYLAH